ncbi:MAG: NAD-dependent epimerase/dehydratase family protein [Patescibacteria group bacterium]|nr:NAD-dependent epimerase/dehydratase family protein [Patescibacteria group bacterium]
MPNKKIIFDKKNVLVTGGAGFIGSHLCDEMVKDSKVICLDNFISGDEKNIDHLLAEPNFEFIKHDISKPIDLEAQPELAKFKIKFQGIQEIYHFACPMSPKDFEKNKIEILLANSHGTVNALELAVKYDAKFIHASSSVIYGQESGEEQSVTENYFGKINLDSATACYDEGKRFAESLVSTYQQKYKLDARIARLFRVYGPRMKFNDGQMIPDFINNALDNKDLEIFGNKDFTSSFCYISDCVDAIIKLSQSDYTQAVNIGSDVKVNLTTLAKKIIVITEAESNIKYSDRLIFMRPLLIPNIDKAKQEFAWMPVISLDKGLRTTVYELQANKGLKNVQYAINEKQ